MVAETYREDAASQAGYKLHVTVTTQHHEAAGAASSSPTLRILHTHHKVVLPGFNTPTSTTGQQAGKFITVYAGPAGGGAAYRRDDRPGAGPTAAPAASSPVPGQ